MAARRATPPPRLPHHDTALSIIGFGGGGMVIGPHRWILAGDRQRSEEVGY